MKSARPIALWLAAMIVMVAAALMPSGARAHGTHGHGAPSQSASAPARDVVAADRAVSSVAGAAARLAGPSSIVRGDAVPAVETARMACACPACLSGGPCGHAPSSCCATGLTPAPVPALIPPATCHCAPARDGPPLSGIVPEAQTEPPKPLA